MKSDEVKGVRKACQALAASSKHDRRYAIEPLIEEWRAAREQLEASIPTLENTASTEMFRDWLRERIEAGGDPNELAVDVERRLATLERVVREAEQPGTWADRWRMDGPRLDDEEAKRRLDRVRHTTAKTARSTAEALRRVLAARREHGVPLYDTYVKSTSDRYLNAAAQAELGFLPKASDRPNTTPSDRAAWGIFKVYGNPDPKIARPLFTAFPPFPVRSEMLEARISAPQIAPAAGPVARNDASRSTTGTTPGPGSDLDFDL
jgi:hypothetical protein